MDSTNVETTTTDEQRQAEAALRAQLASSQDEETVKGKGLPIRPIEEIKAEVEKICGGKPAKARVLDNPVAVVEWVDGTVIDTVWQVAADNPYAPKVSGGE